VLSSGPLPSSRNPASSREGVGASASTSSTPSASASQVRGTVLPRESMLPHPSSPTHKKSTAGSGSSAAAARSARLSYIRGSAPVPAAAPSPSNSVSPPATRTLPDKQALPVAARPRLVDVSVGDVSDMQASGESLLHGRYEGDPIASPVRRPTHAATAAAATAPLVPEHKYASKIPRPSQQSGSGGARAKSKSAVGNGAGPAPAVATAASSTGTTSYNAPSQDPLLGMHRPLHSSRPDASRGAAASASHGYARSQYARPVNAVAPSATTPVAGASGSAARPGSRGMHPPTPPVAGNTVGSRRGAAPLITSTSAPFDEPPLQDVPASAAGAWAGPPQREFTTDDVGLSAERLHEHVPEISDEQPSLPAAAASSLSLLRARSGGYRRPVRKAVAGSSTGVLHPPRSAAPRGGASGGHFGVGEDTSQSLHDDAPTLSLAWQAPPSEAQLQAAADAQVRALALRLSQQAPLASSRAHDSQPGDFMMNREQRGAHGLPTTAWNYDFNRSAADSDQWHQQAAFYGSQADSNPDIVEALRGMRPAHPSVRTADMHPLRPSDASPLMWPAAAGGDQMVSVGVLAGLSAAPPSDAGSRQSAAAVRRGTATGGSATAKSVHVGSRASTQMKASATAAASAPPPSFDPVGVAASKATRESLVGAAVSASLVAVGQSSQHHSRPHAAPGGSSFSTHGHGGNSSGGNGPYLSLQYAADRGEGDFSLRASPVRLPDTSMSSQSRSVTVVGGGGGASCASGGAGKQGGSGHGLVIAGGGLVGTGAGGAASFRQPVPPNTGLLEQQQPLRSSRVIMSATPDLEVLASDRRVGPPGGAMAFGSVFRSERASSDVDQADLYGASMGDHEGEGGNSESLGDNVGGVVGAASNAFLPALMAVGRAIGASGDGAYGGGASNVGGALPSSGALLWTDASVDAGGGHLPLPQQPGGGGRNSTIASPRLLYQHQQGSRQQLVLPAGGGILSSAAAAAAAASGAPSSGGSVPAVRTRGALSSLGAAAAGGSTNAWDAPVAATSGPFGSVGGSGVGGSRRTLHAPSPFLSYANDHLGES
jgi:hypothetical protein